MGLNESFAHLRGQILLMDPLPPINKIFSMVMQEEHQREITTMASKSTQPVAQFQGSKPQGFSRKERPLCTHCGLLGHTIEKCYKLHGYPPRYKFTRDKKVASSANMAVDSMPSLPIFSEQCQ
jgi:hypothetical protein